MGSIAQSSAFDTLHELGTETLPVENVLEILWAVAHFVYLGDNEVKFVRHTADLQESNGAKKEKLAWQAATTSFTIQENMSPVNIAETNSQWTYDNGGVCLLEADTTAPGFVQLIRDTSLLLIHGSKEFTWDELPLDLQEVIYPLLSN